MISLPPEMLKVKSSPSTSLPDKLIEQDPSSSNDTSSVLARTGASLIALTVTVNVSELERRALIKEALDLKVGKEGSNSLPSTFMVKDHYSSAPWSQRISGKSHWDKKWIDMEFDPVMEIDLNPEWKT